MLTTLLTVALVVLIAGVLVWAIRSFPAIDETFKQVAIVLIIVIVAIYALVVVFRLLGVTLALP